MASKNSRCKLRGRIAGPTPDGKPHLFICTRHVVELDQAENILEQLRVVKVGGCDHYIGWEREVDMFARLLVGANSSSLSFRGQMVACGACACDMQARISKDSVASVFVTVELTCWRDLGPRGSHRNQMWGGARDKFTTDSFVRSPANGGWTYDGPYAFGTRSLRDVFDAAQQ